MSVPVAYAVIHDHTLDLNNVPSVRPYRNDSDIEHVGNKILPLHPWPAMMFALPGTAAAEVIGVHVATLSPSGPNRTFPIEIGTGALLVAIASVVMALVGLELLAEGRDGDDGKHGGDSEAGTRLARRYAVGTALVFAFATSAWSTASRALWDHTPAMLFASIALLAALRSARDIRYLWALGAALALGYTMRPSMVVPLVVLGLWALVEHRLKAWRVLMAGLVVAAPFIAVNLTYYHSLLPAYYTGTGNGLSENYGFFESLGVELISPSRGLFIYTPIFVLIFIGVGIRRAQRRFGGLDLAVAGICVLYLLVNTASGSTGGTSYGARLFTDILPFLVYFCLPVFEKLAMRRIRSTLSFVGVSVLVVVSVAVNAVGATTHASLCWSATPVYINNDPGRVWNWNDPQFLRPFKKLADGRSLSSVLVGNCSTGATHASSG